MLEVPGYDFVAVGSHFDHKRAANMAAKEFVQFLDRDSKLDLEGDPTNEVFSLQNFHLYS